MAKQSSRSSSKSSATKSTTSRPKPMAPKAGVTKQRSRYGNGGDFCY